MTLLWTIAGFSLLSWALRRLARASERPVGVSPHPEPPIAPTRSTRAENEVSRLQARFATSDMTVEEFEAQVADALEHPSPEPVYTERVEVNIYDAPADSSLHIHV